MAIYSVRGCFWFPLAILLIMPPRPPRAHSPSPLPPPPHSSPPHHLPHPLPSRTVEDHCKGQRLMKV
eukprot:6293331-Pyramimonas_sp.AAC.1